jgi:hypothetical protein
VAAQPTSRLLGPTLMMSRFRVVSTEPSSRAGQKFGEVGLLETHLFHSCIVAKAVGTRCRNSDPRKAISLQDGTCFTRIVPCFAQRGDVEKTLFKATRRVDD